MFEGLYVALVTPFTNDDTVNTAKLKELVRFHLRHGTDGLVLYGTTGEGGCLNSTECSLILDTVLEEASGRIKVIAGAGSRSTRQTLINIQDSKKAGADGALVVTPFYNRPNQEGLYRHFLKVAEEGGLPIILYNVQVRTGVDLLPETVMRLADVPNIVAIKEARPDTDRLTELVMGCGDRLNVLTGHDPNLLPALSVGCKGIVSVVGNIEPEPCKQLISAFRQGDAETTMHLHFKLYALCKALAIDTNPIPIKEAMNLLGWEMGSVRLPLLSLNEERKAALRSRLADYGFAL
ncbi:MAG: 4-hydroxy-tetrahydrodipicolinate synthase [Planctomycetota bacterium]